MHLIHMKRSSTRWPQRKNVNSIFYTFLLTSHHDFGDGYTSIISILSKKWSDEGQTELSTLLSYRLIFSLALMKFLSGVHLSFVLNKLIECIIVTYSFLSLSCSLLLFHTIKYAILSNFIALSYIKIYSIPDILFYVEEIFHNLY